MTGCVLKLFREDMQKMPEFMPKNEATFTKLHCESETSAKQND